MDSTDKSAVTYRIYLDALQMCAKKQRHEVERLPSMTCTLANMGNVES